MSQVIVISGGSKGIGKAIAEKFASNGYQIFICARGENEMAQVKNELEGKHPQTNVLTFKADLSNKKESIAFAEFINENCVQVDILVNNAGIFQPGELTKEDESSFELQMNINLYSAYYLTRGLIDSLKKSASGHIFNMCSVASLMAYPNGGAYCVSKFALYGMSKVLREELKNDGIRVTSIMPGATYTASWEGAELPIDRFMKAEDVAESVWSAYSMSPNSVVEEIVIRPQLGDI